MEDVIRIAWIRDETEHLMQFETSCLNGESAHRVFLRLSAVLKALVSDEARRAEGESKCHVVGSEDFFAVRGSSS